MGSEVFIVDRRYVYGDVLGAIGTLFAVIDTDRQRVYPWLNPSRYYGGRVAEPFGLRREPDIRKVSRKSLLIDDEFLLDEMENTKFGLHLPNGIDVRISSTDQLVCRNLYVINFAVGLTEFVRKLLGLPIKYHHFQKRLFGE